MQNNPPETQDNESNMKEIKNEKGTSLNEGESPREVMDDEDQAEDKEEDYQAIDDSSKTQKYTIITCANSIQ
jgi:hypothetical protein